MKRLASAITLSIASIVAMAADPQVGEQAPLVLTYNQAPVTTRDSAPAETVSKQQTERVMTQTLGMVSANLAYELDSRVVAEFTARKQ